MKTIQNPRRHAGKQVAKVNPPAAPALVTGGGQLPDFLQDEIVATAGQGVSTSARDTVVPFLAILQSGSPQVKKQNGEYIQGAEPGMIMNTATKQLWGPGEKDAPWGPIVMPAGMQHTFVEWVSRKDGGGYVTNHPSDTPLQKGLKEDENGRAIRMANGHDLIETMYRFVLEEESMEAMVMAMASSQLGVSRNWEAVIRNFKVNTPNGRVPAASYARRYQISTVYTEKGGNDWFKFKVDDLGWVQDGSIFVRAKKLFEASQKGEVTVGRPIDNGEGGGASGSGGDQGDDGIDV